MLILRQYNMLAISISLQSGTAIGADQQGKEGCAPHLITFQPPDEGGQAHTVSPSCPHPPMNVCRHSHHQCPPIAFETKLGGGVGATSLAEKASFVLINELVIKYILEIFFYSSIHSQSRLSLLGHKQ